MPNQVHLQNLIKNYYQFIPKKFKLKHYKYQYYILQLSFILIIGRFATKPIDNCEEFKCYSKFIHYLYYSNYYQNLDINLLILLKNKKKFLIMNQLMFLWLQCNLCQRQLLVYIQRNPKTMNLHTIRYFMNYQYLVQILRII